MKIHGEPQFTVLRCYEMQYDRALAHLLLSNDGEWKSWKLETRVLGYQNSNHI